MYSTDVYKQFEHDTLVSRILSEYVVCRPDILLQSLVEDSDIYGLVEYWAEINRTDKLSILDAVEMSINKIADFKVISTSLCQGSLTLHSILKLQNDIIIPLDWCLD